MSKRTDNTTILDNSPGALLFKAKIDKFLNEGWYDPDFIARQMVDDLYREYGESYHTRQGMIEHMIELHMWGEL